MVKNPLGKIKDLTRGAASVGMHVAGQATRSATSMTAGAVSKLVQGHRPTIVPEPATPPDLKAPEPDAEPAVRTAPKAPEPTPEPVTSIDAAADTAHVDVTPADLAAKMAKSAPARKAAAPKAPAARKATAAKTTPGAKLPPRKKLDEPRQAESTSGVDQG